MEAIVTRLTSRNFCLKQSDFTLSAQPDTDYGHVIQIEEGQANIQGYHVITNTYLRVPPPTSITGQKIALGMKLERDTSSHLLGDVTENLVTRYMGIWVSYFRVEDAQANPDIFILGYLDWDGSNFSNVYDNPEKLGKFDAKDLKGTLLARDDIIFELENSYKKLVSMFDGLNIKDLECLENSLQDSDEDKKIGKMSDRRKEFYDKYVFTKAQ